MAIKDFFDNKKPLFSKNLDELSEVEDSKYIKGKYKKDKDFQPQVDYSVPSEFAYYGRAEKYYEDTFDHIAATYPYDGSGVEKINWYNSSSYIDKYFYDNIYPRETGYVEFIHDDGNGLASTGGDWKQNYFKNSTDHYIEFRGGYNTGSEMGNSLVDGFDESNVYDPTTSREQNIVLDMDKGITVEFWMKNNVPNTCSVVLDIWNSSSVATSKGRFTIEVSGSSFAIGAQSGSKDGMLNEILGDFSGINIDSWNHYCVRAYNTGSDFAADIFVNGQKNDSFISSSYALSEITGAIEGRINTFVTDKFDGGAIATDLESYGALSGAVDEFRFWNIKRTDKDIKRFWKSDVFGGSNDKDGNTDLGLYYKFNEGKTFTGSIDSVILDYSGRISNGVYVNYTSVSSSSSPVRITGSAIEEATDNKEFHDPVIYSSNPKVVEKRNTYITKGRVYDYSNNMSLYNSVPQWILEEGGDIGRFTQIMGSYLDTLHAQIKHLNRFKDKTYASSSMKSQPFNNRLLTNQGMVSPEVFENASQLEKIYSRDEDILFDEDLAEVKNSIYKNIYNNIDEVYKSKGTLNSFRNLLRCFGLNEDIVGIRYYLDNNETEVTDIRDNSVVKKKYIDYSKNENNGATIYQYDIDGDSVSYITGSTDYLNEAFSFESNVRFPLKPLSNSDRYADFFYNNLTSSLFGVYNPPSNSPDSIEFDNTNQYGFQVYSVRDNVNRNRVKFKLSSSSGVFDLETSDFYDAYNNNDWIFSVSVHPEKGRNTDFVSGSESSTQDYTLKFYGAEIFDKQVINDFELTSSIAYADALNFYTSPKRVYVGAERQDFTGSLINGTDVKIGSVAAWLDERSTETIITSSYDINNYGNIIGDGNFDDLLEYELLNTERLIFGWKFDNISTGSLSSTSGGRYGFEINDVTSGSNSSNRYRSSYDDILGRSYSGRGDNYSASDKEGVVKNNVITLRPKMLDDSLNSNEISIRETNTEEFGNNKITKKIVRMEKSVFASISQEMLNWIESVVEFNSIIGDPHNQYTFKYNKLHKLRQLFFENVGATPKVEKYLKYYKWFDNALSEMMKELIPASSNIAGNIENVIENHAFTRNKKYYKPVSLKRKMFNTVQTFSSNQSKLKTNWNALKAPVNSSVVESLNYWKYTADRTRPEITSGDSSVDSDRNQIKDVLASGLDKIEDINSIKNPLKKRVRKLNNSSLGSFNDTITSGNKHDLSIFSSDYFQDPLGIKGNEKYFYGSNYLESNIRTISSTDRESLWDTKTSPFNLVHVGTDTTTQYLDHNSKFDIVNHLNDLYGEFEQDPLQGPYTKDKVGGSFARHNSVLRNLDFDNRSEEFYISQLNGLFYVSSAKYLHRADASSSVESIENQPRAYTYRDQVAKKPLSVQNIKHTGSTVGNFEKNYEVFVSTGRNENNLFLRDNEEFNNDNGSTYIYPEVSNLRSFEAGAEFTPSKDFELLEFSGSNSIIASRFSAPGEQDYNNLGTHDIFSREYTNYSTNNYRNLKARKEVDEESTDHFDINDFV